MKRMRAGSQPFQKGSGDHRGRQVSAHRQAGFAIAAALLAVAGSFTVAAETTQPIEGIVPVNARPAAPGPSSFFTGKATVRPIVDAEQMGNTTVGEVVFQPKARSNWHTHPGGQALYITGGCGWTQREGGPIVRICKGDSAYVPAGVRHWHGATSMTAMRQLSISEDVGGKNVIWMEPVPDAQYNAGPKAAR